MLRTFLIGILVCFATAIHAEQRELVVFAAASLTDVLNEIGIAYTRDSKTPVKFSFAASSALARQIESGAPAQIFFSADTDWMDYLQSRALIEQGTRENVVENRLVLVAPADSTIQLRIEPHMPIARALNGGRLATGDPDSVPIGKYARDALMSLGVWDDVADRLVRAENVRSALAFVARGEAPLGIVYQTDAQLDKRVRVVGTFSYSSHPAIVYSAAVVKGAVPNARGFVRFLKAEPAQALFRKYGFKTFAGP